MLQPGYDYWNQIEDYPALALDNGCFSQGDAFDLARWLSWLSDNRQDRVPVLFAVAPDILGDATATWQRSLPVLSRIRALGYSAALVAQDGWNGDVDWSAFDCLFIGGTDAFKLSLASCDAVVEAKARGKWVHMGRVNSLRRLVAARHMGCDSADGTFLKFGPDLNLPRVLGWLRQLEIQPMLPLVTRQTGRDHG